VENRAAEKRDASSVLQGTVSRITYQHIETHYTVARLDVEGGPSVTVVGAIFPVSEGEEIKVTGAWKKHPRYGLQFQVERWEKIDPATIEGIEKYLGSGLVKGIGPTYAKRLVSAFGLETLKILTEEPLRILEVDGICKRGKRSAACRTSWFSCKDTGSGLRWPCGSIASLVPKRPRGCGRIPTY
jgi:exodeoxyribonuclease V alpha subunit